MGFSAFRNKSLQFDVIVLQAKPHCSFAYLRLQCYLTIHLNMTVTLHASSFTLFHTALTSIVYYNRLPANVHHHLRPQPHVSECYLPLLPWQHKNLSNRIQFVFFFMFPPLYNLPLGNYIAFLFLLLFISIFLFLEHRLKLNWMYYLFIKAFKHKRIFALP